MPRANNAILETMKTFFLKLLPLLVFAACYDPEPYVASVEDKGPSTSESEIGKVFPINGGVSFQICNPSVSQDTARFPASMLWLNFSKIGVKAPDSVYNVVSSKDRKVSQHDRLTISDTSETVLWYLMRDTANGDCQFQDPEWSTHPNFIASLRAYDVNGSKACSPDNLDYGIIAVRISDKKRFVFYDKKESEFGDPHIWVDPSVVEPDTSTSDTTIRGFFGTDRVRLVFVRTKEENMQVRELVFRDFANGGKEVKLKLPKGYNGKSLENPLISPDGKFVTYNLVDASQTNWDAYIQELSKNSEPMKIEKLDGMISAPAQPHWFQYDGRLFVVWAETDGFIRNDKDYTVSSIQDGSAGRTAMREVRLSPGAASDLAMEWIGDVRELAPLPMIGGRSPDSKFLATGTSHGFMIELP